MARSTSSSRRNVASAILERYGQTFSEELGIPIERNTPSPLFRLLCYSLLSSAPIGHTLSLRAARGLAEAGWTTPRAMAGSTWRQRVRVLDQAGYARYDESKAEALGDTCAHLLETYGGDLRRLRVRAERVPDREAELLLEFKGIGAVSAGIFLREVQIVWDEIYPYADDRVVDAARRLGLGADVEEWRDLTRSRRDFVRLVAGIMRVRLDDAFDEVCRAA